MAEGWKAYLGIAVETNYGGGANAPQYFLPFLSEGLGIEFETLREARLMGRVDQPKFYLGMKTMNGDVVTEFFPDYAGYFLTSAIGSPVSSNSASNYTIMTNTTLSNLTVFTPVNSNHLYAQLNILVSNWGNSNIACVVDGTALGVGLTNETVLLNSNGTYTTTNYFSDVDSFTISNYLNSNTAIEVSIPYYYQHTWTPEQTNYASNSALIPLSLEVYKGISNAFRYESCVVNTLKLGVGTGDKVMKQTATTIAKDYSLTNAATTVYKATNPFRWNHCSIAIAATTNEDIENFELTLNNNCEGYATMTGTSVITKIRRTGFRTAEMSFNHDFVSMAEFSNFANQAEQTNIITLTAADEVFTDVPFSMVIGIRSMKYTGYPVNVGGPGPVTVGVAGTLEFNETAGKTMDIVIINDHPTYTR